MGEVQELKEAFALFDNDKGGSIEPEEFQKALADLGCDAEVQEIAELVGIADAGKAGRIDFPAFLDQFQHIDNEDLDNESNEAWKLLSKGGDCVTAANIKEFLGKFDLKLSDEETSATIKFGDKDGDGKLGEADFKALYLATSKSLSRKKIMAWSLTTRRVPLR